MSSSASSSSSSSSPPNSLHPQSINCRSVAVTSTAADTLRIPSPDLRQRKNMMVKDGALSPDEDPDLQQSTRSMGYLMLGPTDRLKSASLEWMLSNGSVTPRNSHYNTHPPLDFKSLKEKLEKLTGSPDDVNRKFSSNYEKRRNAAVPGIPMVPSIVTSPVTERCSPEVPSGVEIKLLRKGSFQNTSFEPIHLHKCLSTGDVRELERTRSNTPTSSDFVDHQSMAAEQWTNLAQDMADRDDTLRKILKRHNQELQDLKKKHELQWSELHRRLLQSGAKLEDSQFSKGILYSCPVNNSFQTACSNTTARPLETIANALARGSQTHLPSIRVDDGETTTGNLVEQEEEEAMDQEQRQFIDVRRRAREGETRDIVLDNGVRRDRNEKVKDVTGRFVVGDSLAFDEQGAKQDEVVCRSQVSIPYQASLSINTCGQMQSAKPNFGYSPLEWYQNELAGLTGQLTWTPIYHQMSPPMPPLPHKMTTALPVPMNLGFRAIPFRHSPQHHYDSSSYLNRVHPPLLPALFQSPTLLQDQWMTTTGLESLDSSTEYNTYSSASLTPNSAKCLSLPALLFVGHSPCHVMSNCLPPSKLPLYSNQQLKELALKNAIAMLPSLIPIVPHLSPYLSACQSPCSLRMSPYAALNGAPLFFQYPAITQNGIRPFPFPSLTSSRPLHTRKQPWSDLTTANC